MVALNNKEALENNSTKILKSKKGVCSDYTKIFKEIANKVGIDTETISGYTKQNGVVTRCLMLGVLLKLIISGISSIQLGVLALNNGKFVNALTIVILKRILAK
jgi:hypothetical protein